MSADHPERVAKWLGEVFGGPTRYSSEYGGYPRMLSQHIGKGLTRSSAPAGSQLILQSAREAGLPNDAGVPLRASAPTSSGARGWRWRTPRPSAKPPEHMPMPHWDWHTAAGPPGSRISALAAAATEQGAATSVLPGRRRAASASSSTSSRCSATATGSR